MSRRLEANENNDYVCTCTAQIGHLGDSGVTLTEGFYPEERGYQAPSSSQPEIPSFGRTRQQLRSASGRRQRGYSSARGGVPDYGRAATLFGGRWFSQWPAPIPRGQAFQAHCLNCGKGWRPVNPPPPRIPNQQGAERLPEPGALTLPDLQPFLRVDTPAAPCED